MRVLVACEFSGTVRDAFKVFGHDAWSCDLLPTEKEGNHYQGDVFDIIEDGWDLMIAHPPCTYLASVGLNWNNRVEGRWQKTEEALEFIQRLLNAAIPRIALENPVGIISTRIRKPDQIINPFQFGHPQRKATCLWLKNLPKLISTNEVIPEEGIRDKNGKLRYFVDQQARTKDRWKIRSRTFQGIAEGMAAQWGSL